LAAAPSANKGLFVFYRSEVYFMNIFDFLSGEGRSIVRRLNAVVEHYPACSDWTWDHTFDETKKDIFMLAEYLREEKLVESMVRGPHNLKAHMYNAAEQRREINACLDHVLMIHIDEEGFREGLKKLAEKLDEHTNFCINSYYPLLEQNLSNDAMQNLEDQLEFSLSA
jgi:hypothetical protein